MTTVTAPPPAVPSARVWAACFCTWSCILAACFIICWMFIPSPLRRRGCRPGTRRAASARRARSSPRPSADPFRPAARVGAGDAAGPLSTRQVTVIGRPARLVASSLEPGTQRLEARRPSAWAAIRRRTSRIRRRPRPAAPAGRPCPSRPGRAMRLTSAEERLAEPRQRRLRHVARRAGCGAPAVPAALGVPRAQRSPGQPAGRRWRARRHGGRLGADGAAGGGGADAPRADAPSDGAGAGDADRGASAGAGSPPPPGSPSSSAVSGTSLRRCTQRSSAISRWKRGCARHLDVLFELGDQLERAQQILAREARRDRAAAARRRLRSRTPDPRSAPGSTCSTIRSRTRRASSRQTWRRSWPDSTSRPATSNTRAASSSATTSSRSSSTSRSTRPSTSDTVVASISAPPNAIT